MKQAHGVPRSGKEAHKVRPGERCAADDEDVHIDCHAEVGLWMKYGALIIRAGVEGGQMYRTERGAIEC